MHISQPRSRRVLLAKADDLQRDTNGHWEYKPGNFGMPTRAVQTTPRFDLITPIIALDGDFQLAKVESTGEHIQRIGRISIVNHSGKVIIDAFVNYPETDGTTKRLPPSRLGLGVYKQDIHLRNGALSIAEVKQIVRTIVEGRVNVGHAIKNDFVVFSPQVFDGVKTRDTQMRPEYRQYATGSQRLPKLSVLAKEVLGMDIQGSDHSSVEDAQATMLLYHHREAVFEALQGQDVHYASPKANDHGLLDWSDVQDYGVDDLEVQETNEVFEVLPPLNESEIAEGHRVAASFWGAASGAVKEKLAAETRRGPSKAAPGLPYAKIESSSRRFDSVTTGSSTGSSDSSLNSTVASSQVTSQTSSPASVESLTRSSNINPAKDSDEAKARARIMIACPVKVTHPVRAHDNAVPLPSFQSTAPSKGNEQPV